MQSIIAGLQTEFGKTGSVPERVFKYQGVDKSTYVGRWSSITRRADAIVSGNVTLEVANTDQAWNVILSSPQTHIIPGATASTIQVGYTAIGFMTLFTGKLESADFRGVDSVSLSFKDKIAYFTEAQIGSSQVPADYYSASGVSVTDFSGGTSRDWSAGRNPADLFWSILVTYGGLDSTESVANVDIDWTTFLAYKTLLDSIGIKVQGYFKGENIATALQELSDVAVSTIFSEADGKLYVRYWLGQDNTSVQSYTSAKWKEIPTVSMDRLNIKNSHVIYYGFTFTNSVTGTATSGTSTTLVDSTKTWTANAYKNYIINITAGTGVGQSRLIGSNDATSITINFAWTNTPDATSTYKIYDPSAGAFAGSITKSDPTSIGYYGTLQRVWDSQIVWNYDSSSAGNMGDRQLLDTKDPIKYVAFESFLLAYRQQLWDALKLTESFYSWTDQGFRIEELSFNTNDGTVGISGRTTTLYPFLILDDPVNGKLDSIYVLA
jgi:hypothetical protein